MQRKTAILVMATDDEKAFYRGFAQINGLTVSGLIRHAIAMMVQQQQNYSRSQTSQEGSQIGS